MISILASAPCVWIWDLQLQTGRSPSSQRFSALALISGILVPVDSERAFLFPPPHSQPHLGEIVNPGTLRLQSHVHLWRSAIEYHPASKFSHCGEPIFGCGVGGEKKPQILLPTLLRSHSQLCSRFEGLCLQNMWPLLQSKQLRLHN